MSKPDFTGASLKVERAKRHKHDLDAEIEAFKSRQPYSVFTETDAKTGDKLFRVRIREEVPPYLSTIIGDIIHNLRATFDLIAAEIVAANGGDRNNAYFPVSYTPESFHSKGRRKVRAATQDAVDLVERFQPYHVGNEPLCKIHKLDILDKHQAIVPVGAAYRHFGIAPKINVPWRDEPVQFPAINIRPADRQFPLQNGAVIFYISANSNENIKSNYEFAFEVAFGEGQIVDGEPVTKKLREFGEFTDGALDLFR